MKAERDLPVSLINGKFKDEVSIYDRIVNYGDGLFETILVVDGQLVLEELHFERLMRDAIRLGIVSSADNELEHKIRQDIRGLFTEIELPVHCILKIIVSRGKGEHGYQWCGMNASPTRILSVRARPSSAPEDGQTSATAGLCELQLARSSLLAGVKHTNRLEQVLASAERFESDVDERLLCDTHGNVIEGLISNLFVIEQGCVVSPDLKYSGVNGVLRTHLINVVCPQLGLVVKIENISVERLLQADEVLIGNSVRGLRPLTRLLINENTGAAQYHWHCGAIGKKLMQTVNGLFRAA